MKQGEWEFPEVIAYTVFTKGGDQMKRRIAKQGEKIYLIKANLSDWYGRVRGYPYRVLAIPEEITLYSLAKAILDSFNFDFDHALGFITT